MSGLGHFKKSTGEVSAKAGLIQIWGSSMARFTLQLAVQIKHTKRNQIKSSVQWFMWRPGTKRVRKDKSKGGPPIKSQGLE